MVSEKNKKIILGITAFNHDASACIIKDDNLLAFCEEERFNRNKHTGDFPINAINFCLEKANISMDDITDIAFYFNPIKCLKNYFKINNPVYNPRLFFINKRFYYEAVWLLKFINKIGSIKRILNNKKIKFNFISHHLAHVWYGYFASDFKNCTVISNDSIGEDISSLAVKFVFDGKIKTFTTFKQYDPHSLGYLYGAITEYLGYKRGDGEGRVMAMASYGSDKYVHFASSMHIYEKHYLMVKNILRNRTKNAKIRMPKMKDLQEIKILQNNENYIRTGNGKMKILNDRFYRWCCKILIDKKYERNNN